MRKRPDYPRSDIIQINEAVEKYGDFGMLTIYRTDEGVGSYRLCTMRRRTIGYIFLPKALAVPLEVLEALGKESFTGRQLINAMERYATENGKQHWLFSKKQDRKKGYLTLGDVCKQYREPQDAILEIEKVGGTYYIAGILTVGGKKIRDQKAVVSANN